MHKEINHPLVKHKLSVLRDTDTNYKHFREKVSEITMLIAYDAMKNLKTEQVKIKTPICETVGEKIASDIVVVPVLRAGVGMLEGILALVPYARVGFVGLYRDHETKQPVAYYEKFPENLRDPKVFILDPMVATGGSLIASADMLKSSGFTDITIISVLSAPEGIRAIEDKHPDIDIFTGSVDSHLNSNKYIVPGLGDAGDRLFGTK